MKNLKGGISMLFIKGFPFMLLVICGCSHSIKNGSEYLKWLNNPSNGIVKVRHVEGFDVRVKFLPAEYLLYQEISRSDAHYSATQKDSLLNMFKHSLTFIMTIGPDTNDNNHSDVMYYGVKTYKDYVNKDIIMNFDFKQYITLSAGGRKYAPVLSAMENSYELGLSRNIIFAFVPNNKTDYALFESSQLDFTYDDELFDIGINHFVFQQRDLQNIPAYPGLVIN